MFLLDHVVSSLLDRALHIVLIFQLFSIFIGLHEFSYRPSFQRFVYHFVIISSVTCSGFHGCVGF